MPTYTHGAPAVSVAKTTGMWSSLKDGLRTPSPGVGPPPAAARAARVAEAVLDEEGLDALSMRSLGNRLGAGATSLYRHVANKDELIERGGRDLRRDAGARGGSHPRFEDGYAARRDQDPGSLRENNFAYGLRCVLETRLA
ncbi:helix-turn-helix domain-containing protein [Spirillospora sp. CA-255316]